MSHTKCDNIVSNIYNMSGRSVLGDTMASRRRAIVSPNADRTRILYMAYDIHQYSYCLLTIEKNQFKIL